MDNWIAQRYVQLSHQDTKPNKCKNIARDCDPTLNIVFGNRQYKAGTSASAKPTQPRTNTEYKFNPLIS